MASDQAVSVFGVQFSSIFAFSALAFAVALILGAFFFAFRALQSSAEARIARAEAEVKLSAAQALSAEVSRLRAQVEEAVLHHNSAVANAFLMHNDACAATRTSAVKSAAGGGHDPFHHGHRHDAPAPKAKPMEDAAAFRARARAEAVHADQAHGDHIVADKRAPSFLHGFLQRAKPGSR